MNNEDLGTGHVGSVQALMWFFTGHAIVKTDCTVFLIPLMLFVVLKGSSLLSGCEGLDAEVSLWLRSSIR